MPSRRSGHARVALVALAGVLAGPQQPAAAPAADGSRPQAVFTASVDTVRVDVSVRQNGQSVVGLTADDFEVLDNGVPQRLELVGFEEVPADVVIALDMSGSVHGERLAALRSAAERLLALLRPRDRSALVRFTERVLAGPFTGDAARTATDLADQVTGRDTAVVDAVHAALVLSATARSRSVVLVFSDGADTASFLSPDQVLDTARRVSTTVHVVSAAARPTTGGSGLHDTFLDDLVRLSGGRRLDVSSPDHVAEAFAALLAAARERYLLSYVPRGVPPRGWHTLTVRVRGRRADVQARPGYLAGS